MSFAAILLVTISAFLHAGWNMFSKSKSPSVGFFLLATWGTVLCSFPILFWTFDFVWQLAFSSVAWWILTAAGFFQALYYFGLAGAYRRGDLSIVYPLARSFPLVILVGLAFLVGEGQSFSLSGLIGLFAILCGAIILPMNSFRDFRWQNYFNPACAFVLVAALGTAGYSFVDDVAMNALKEIPHILSNWARAVLYLFLECVATAVWMHLFLLFSKSARQELQIQARKLAKPALQAGFAIGLTYCLVLLAMTQATQVAYIVGLRQLSIPIGTFLGVAVLKEKGSIPRAVGVSLLFVGLLLIILQ